jgi:hypothetical protein
VYRHHGVPIDGAGPVALAVIAPVDAVYFGSDDAVNHLEIATPDCYAAVAAVSRRLEIHQ